MRKMMMLAAMLALVMAIAVPAMAQVSQELGQESESGDANVQFKVSSSGNYDSQCVAPLQFANTGNLQNAQGFLQYRSTADDLEAEGSTFGFFTGPGSGINTTCTQQVQQAAAASSN